MKNTGKKLGMYCEHLNWNFSRTIWEDSEGEWYVKVNGYYFEFEDAKEKCDSWCVLF